MSITQSNNVDDYSHNVPRSQLYPLCNYLEKLNDNKKSAAYQISKKKKQTFFIYKESIANPLVEFKPKIGFIFSE